MSNPDLRHCHSRRHQTEIDEDYASLAQTLGREETACLGRPRDVLVLMKGLAWRKGWPPTGRPRPARINGYPGLVLEDEDGARIIAFEPGEDGGLVAIYIVRNPDKLRRATT